MMTLLVAIGLGWYFLPRIFPSAPPKPQAPVLCHVKRHDGPWAICLQRASGNILVNNVPVAEWTWSAEGEAVMDFLGQGHVVSNPGKAFPSDDAALADAWVTLVDHPVPYVVVASRDAFGLRLDKNGHVSVMNNAQYLNEAAQTITTAAAQGDDAAGVVISLLTAAFGSNWNPLRVVIAGKGLQAAAARYDAARKLPAATPQSLAKAIMGLPA